MKEENHSSELSSPGGVVYPDTSAEEQASAGDLHSHKYKNGYNETCPVCGDKVSGYHYGILTCESCKGFFKRTVQNKKVHLCVDSRSCPMNKSQRKRCPYCRFQKCLNVGMKLEAVRQDRMRGGRNKFGSMYKQDRALKQQALRQHQILESEMQLASGHETFTVALVEEPLDTKPDLTYLMDVDIVLGYSENNLNSIHSQHNGDSLTVSEIPSLTRLDHSPVNHHVLIPELSLQNSPENVSQNSWEMYSDNGSIFQSSGSFVPSTYNNYEVLPHPSDLPKLPHLIMDMKNSALDESEIKMKLLSFVDSECGYDEMNNNYLSKLLQLLCRLIDQLLFLMVEWARTSVFFRELTVEDQMKLLQSCWSDILVLDLAHRLLRQIWSGDILLENGHRLNHDCLEDLGLADFTDRVFDIVRKMEELKIDDNEYTCLKFLILLNPDVANLENQEFVESCQEKVQAVLMKYCAAFYPSVRDKFSQVLLRLPDIKLVSITAKTFLYSKHLSSELPEQTLLMEMLLAMKK